MKDEYVELRDDSPEGCNKTFKILRSYEGVVTCPYCGNLVED